LEKNVWLVIAEIKRALREIGACPTATPSPTLPAGGRGPDNVIARTEELGTVEFAPGLLLFGDDGANEAFAFDRQDPKWPIVMVPLVGMSRTDMKFIAGTFAEFIQRMAADELWS
jgi:hypothetical protein